MDPQRYAALVVGVVLSLIVAAAISAAVGWRAVEAPELNAKDDSLRVLAVQLEEENGASTWVYYDVGNLKYAPKVVKAPFWRMLTGDVYLVVLADYPADRRVGVVVFVDGVPADKLEPVPRYDASKIRNLGDLYGAVQSAGTYRSNAALLHARNPFAVHEIRIVVYDGNGNYNDVSFKLKPAI